MFKIDLQNVQAVGDAHIVIENNSITEFTGDNSNGKSIVSKLIERMTNGDIRNKEVRRTLIKDGEEQGVVVFTHDTEQLGLILREEARDSLVMYKPNIKENSNEYIMRSISDWDGCVQLIKQFGFRTYDRGNICLQLAPTFGAVPFVTTSGTVNDEIVQDITTDRIADEFIKTFQGITFPIFRERILRLKKDRDSTQAILDNMESYDWKAYEDIAERMSEVYQAIKGYEYFLLEEIPVPKLSVLPVVHHNVTELPVVKFYDLANPIVEIVDELEAYVEVMNGVCPTCGRPLVEREHQEV